MSVPRGGELQNSDALSGHGFNRAVNAAKAIRLQPLRFGFCGPDLTLAFSYRLLSAAQVFARRELRGRKMPAGTPALLTSAF